jgi:hypothetical protein
MFKRQPTAAYILTLAISCIAYNAHAATGQLASDTKPEPSARLRITVHVGYNEKAKKIGRRAAAGAAIGALTGAALYGCRILPVKPSTALLITSALTVTGTIEGAREELVQNADTKRKLYVNTVANGSMGMLGSSILIFLLPKDMRARNNILLTIGGCTIAGLASGIQLTLGNQTKTYIRDAIKNWWTNKKETQKASND